MEISFDRFYQVNRRILIWVGLSGLIWFLRDFFGLIFMVFMLCYLSAPLSKGLQRRLRLPHFVATTLVFLGLLLAVGGLFRYVTPRIVGEAEAVVAKADAIEASALSMQDRLAHRYPYLAKLILGYVRGAIPEADLDEMRSLLPSVPESVADIPDESLPRLYLLKLMGDAREAMPFVMVFAWKATVALLIAMLFAFLISLDTARLRREVDNLRNSRLRDFHEQTAGPVVRFADVVGRALRAQFVIACVNTALTSAGLLVLGMDAVAALAAVVFVCSFIPVLGVFLSTAPMLLVALAGGGVALALWALAMVLAVHTIEAYVLNPFIYGRHLRLNPVMVLIILYVGHHAFGVWGMLLGVPVAHYVLHDVLAVNAAAAPPPDAGPAAS